jgi:lysozyme
VAIGLTGCDRGAPSASCTVRGIDVSRHQGDIDWPKVADAGIVFAWIKATEGGDYLDPAFRRNWSLAQAAGVRRGAYHFVYWCRPAAQQAAWFIATVPNDPDALPPVLDVEWNPGSRTCPQRLERKAALAEMKIMLEAMTQAYGRRPVIYAPADIFEDSLEGAFTDYPLWVRGIHGSPAPEYGPRPWQIWQHSETGAVPGIKGNVDLDCIRDGDLPTLSGR